MDRTTLRKMTFKSKMGFGRYSNDTVQEVLHRTRWGGRSYLVWCYFNLEKISFTDEVLDFLGVAEEDRIEKPGKDPEFWEGVRDVYDNGFSTTGITNKRRTNQQMSRMAREKGRRPSKRYLLGRNHGR